MSTCQESVQRNNKLLGLEVIRFISAFGILIWHYQHFSFVADKPENFNREQQPYYSLLDIFYNYGGASVQIFWCLSGFIFFWKYREKISSNSISFKKFYINRLSRLYPLHLFTLVLVLFLQAAYYYNKKYFFVYQYNDIEHLIYHLFMASNWWGLEIGNSFNGPVWSVSVEMLVYSIFFLLLKVNKSILLNIIIITLGLTAIKLKIPSQVFNCLVFFYIGGLSAIAFKKLQARKNARQIFKIICLVLIASPIIIYSTKIYEHRYFITLFLMLYTPVLLFFSAQPLSLSLSIQKIIEAAGNMTYSIYLVHFPLQLVFVICFDSFGEGIPYYNKEFFWGFMLTTLVSSYLIYKFFELPAQNEIRQKWH
jgi:peptidoglycan/LPS O-acetylase OafA/YrhL